MEQLVQHGTEDDKGTNRTDGQEGGGKAVVLSLRAGAWYAGDARCNSWREAFKKTLRAAEIELPPRPKSIRRRLPPHLERRRLEHKPWWKAFVEARRLREEKGEFPPHFAFSQIPKVASTVTPAGRTHGAGA